MPFRFVKIDPPGSWCQTQAFLEIIRRCNGKTFLEIGVGSGNLSHLLCKKGFNGTGIDLSLPAIQQAEQRLKLFLL